MCAYKYSSVMCVVFFFYILINCKAVLLTLLIIYLLVFIYKSNFLCTW